MTDQTKELIALKKETADIVLAKVQHFQQNRELDLPPNYSAANALKAAWLTIQGVQDKNKQPALSVCNKATIANSLLDMVIQGLNPAKKQCYFVVHGKALTLYRSYFGSKAVALRANHDLEDITEQVIYEGDEVELSIEKGQTFVTGHRRQFGDMDDSKIIGAYAMAIGKDGEVKRCEVMTIEQIKNSWRQSILKPVLDNGNLKAGSTHETFTTEMAKRTVIGRLCKHIINSSDDSDLVIQSARRSDEMKAKADAEAEVEEFGNAETIDVGEEAGAEVIDITPTQENDTQESAQDEPWEPDEEDRKAIQEAEMAEAAVGPGF